MTTKRFINIMTGVIVLLGVTAQSQASSSGMMSDKMFQELKRMIELQQTQLNKQAAEIADLKKQLAGNSETLTTKADKGEIEGTEKTVTSSLSNVNLSLYGHVNKGILYGDNGDSSDWYFVDNTNSQTRLGLKAALDTAGGWSVGGRIEYGIVSNGSSDVNQFNTHDATSSSFKLRWAEFSFKKDTFGKISLGKGSSASDGTAEIDLSGTTVAAYASISDMAGGLLWYEGSTDTLSDLKVKDVYSDFDGLGRTDRLRYDTPSFGGFSLAASASSGDAFDGAALFSRKFGETKVAAAFGVADPGDLNTSTDIQYSGSASVLLPMGLNATFSAAYRDLADSNRDNPTNWYTKLGYKTKFYDAASTAFSIDYGETADLKADGDTAKTWAVAAVHNVTDWATEFYLVYRNHKLNRDYNDFDYIHAFMVGARLKF